MPSHKRSRNRRRRMLLLAAVVAAVALAAGAAYVLYGLGNRGESEGQKPIILYINQGNGPVDSTNFGTMLGFASKQGFNTVFFQVYRQGRLLFPPATLQSFVNQTHQAGLKIFFAFYITNASQALPQSVFGLQEDGISLDMSTLTVPLSAQQSFLAALKQGFGGKTAVTTADMSSPLRPDLLVLETYGASYQQYVRAGIIASVAVYLTSSQTDYQSQFQYALKNSDGVMVFDYYWLQEKGY